MSKVDTWMPLHIGAYLADTMHLTALEHGAYLLLLMHYWRTGPLPNRPTQIAAIARLSPAQWEDIGPTIMEFFALGEDGLWHQKRADAELAKARDISSKRADAARARHGANAEQTDSKSSANAEQLDTHARVARPLPQQEHKEEDCIPTGCVRQAPDEAPLLVLGSDASGPRCGPEWAARIWNERCGPKLGRVQRLTDSRRKKLTARLRNEFANGDGWEAYCIRIASNPFLTGRNDRSWMADFDWCIKPENVCKVLEGKYGRTGAGPPSKYDWMMPDPEPFIDQEAA